MKAAAFVLLLALPCSRGLSQDTTAQAASRTVPIDVVCKDSVSTDSAGAGAGTTLTVHSATSGVKVYADSQYLGETPLSTVVSLEGNHILKYVPPDASHRLSAPVVETLAFRGGEHLSRTVDFPVMVHLTTEPYGATVRRNGVEIGETPLDLAVGSARDLVTVERPGFDPVSVPLAGGEPSIYILLHPKEGVPADPQSLYLAGEQSKSPLPIYITTGVTVLTGATAAILKLKADNRYNDYLQNGDQKSLDDVRRLDLVSGISLGASELSLVGLAYFLLSR